LDVERVVGREETASREFSGDDTDSPVSQQPLNAGCVVVDIIIVVVVVDVVVVVVVIAVVVVVFVGTIRDGEIFFHISIAVMTSMISPSWLLLFFRIPFPRLDDVVWRVSAAVIATVFAAAWTDDGCDEFTDWTLHAQNDPSATVTLPDKSYLDAFRGLDDHRLRATRVAATSAGKWPIKADWNRRVPVLDVLQVQS